MVAKRVLRYLKGMVDYGLLYTPSPILLNVFYDLDSAGDLDDRCSTGGFGLFIGNTFVSCLPRNKG